MKELLAEAQVTQVLGYFAAGQVAKTSDIIDNQDYDGVLFIFGFGTIIENGTLNCQVQQDTDAAGGTMAALAGTAAHTVTAANAALAKSCILVDVARPQERYLRAVVTPAVQNAELLGITAIQYRTHLKPVVQATALKNTQLGEPAQA